MISQATDLQDAQDLTGANRRRVLWILSPCHREIRVEPTNQPTLLRIAFICVVTERQN